MSACASIRSWLFVPGDDARKHDKALASGADALIFDLEDSVTAQLLPKARTRVRNFLASHRERAAQQLWVRVNTLASGKLADDLVLVMAGAPDGIVLPKISNPAEALEIGATLADLEAKFGTAPGRTQLLVIATETPQALFALGDYARTPNPRLAGLTWGAEDLSAALGAAARDASGAFTFTFELARSMCLLAAGAADIPAFDGVCVDFKDATALKREAARASRDGFCGKLAIHPAQVEPINTAFSPQPAEVARARQVIAAFAAKPDAGVLSLDGEMLDRPHLVKAERIVARAARAVAT
ncbi:MAG TPA: CoA ester lyase [Steroidobacteraceae bacterium]